MAWGYSVSSPGQEAGEQVSPGAHTWTGSQDKCSQASGGMDREQNCGEATSEARVNFSRKTLAAIVGMEFEH